MNAQQYLEAKKLFETYDERVADTTLTVEAAWSAHLAEEMRGKRDEALAASDWMMLEDAPTTKSKAASYRKKLRDLPAQTGWPVNIMWPSNPYS
jgi:hypothetical protein